MRVVLTAETEIFIQKLDGKIRAKARRRIDLLCEYGYLLRMPYSRHLTQGIFELRTIGKDNVRLVYIFNDGFAIIFHAFIKKTDKIDRREMGIIRHKRNLLV